MCAATRPPCKRGRGTYLVDVTGAHDNYNGTSRLVETDYTNYLNSTSVEQRNFNLYNAGVNDYNGFDRFGRMKELIWWKYGSGSGYRDSFVYTYDYAGNRLTRDAGPNLVNGSYPDTRDQLFTYDGLHRLKLFKQGTLVSGAIGNPPLEQGWTLDQLGNWPTINVTESNILTLAQSRTHNAVNEITAISATTGTNWADPTHDLAGNMTGVPYPPTPTGNMTLTYDAWNRLVKVVGGPVTLGAYEYDGLGRRIVKDVLTSGEDRDYYYNEQWQLLEERKNSSTNPFAQYVWHPYYVDALAARYYDADTDNIYNENNDGTHYYCQDANYNVTAVTNGSGTVLERYGYTPYGQVTFLESDFDARSPQTSTIGNTHLYTGRELDPETGLQLNRKRYYALHLGRWLTRDPIGYVGSEWNLYEYVASRPINATDPDGLITPPERPPCVGIGDWVRRARSCDAEDNRICKFACIDAGYVGGFAESCDLYIFACFDPEQVWTSTGQTCKCDRDPGADKKRKKWRCTAKPRGCCPEGCDKPFEGFGDTRKEAYNAAFSACVVAGCHTPGGKPNSCNCGHITCRQKPN